MPTNVKGLLVGRGRAVDSSRWPPDGPVRTWFEYLSRIRAAHGMPTGKVIAGKMNLTARSRVSALLRNALPDGEEQAAALLDALGAASYEKDYALLLFRTIGSIPPDDPVAPTRQDSGKAEENPRAKAARLGMRVHHAVFSLPYIPRDVEVEIERYLEEGRPVLLVGSSMVGKTRMAAKVIMAMFAERECLMPETRESLAALGAAHSKTQGSVIFLDDIDRLLGSGGITQAEFDGLAKRNAVVGTIREHEYDGYLPTTRLRPPEWDVLSMFSRVFLHRELSTQEEDRLSQAVDDAEIRDRIIRTGIGEYVGAAEYIAETLRTGLSASPPGHALVLGAADWARAGVRRPVPADLLRELAIPHLNARHRSQLAGTEGYADALRWATREINPTAALLEPEKHDCFSVFDYALDLLATQGDPVPDTTWTLAIEHANPADLVNIGRAARQASLSGTAEQAWRAAEGTQDPESAAYASLDLGNLYREQGDAGSAQAAYERAIGLWRTQAGPVAAVELGNLLKSLNDSDGARAAYEKAIGTTHWWAAPAAAVNLGNLLSAQGDTAGAEQAYQQAIDTELDLDEVKAILTRKFEERDVPAVVEVLDIRQHRPDPEARAIAALQLGHLLARRQDTEGARQSFLRAAEIGPAAIAARALFSLGNLLRTSEDFEGAQEAYNRAIESGDADISPKAAVNLGSMLVMQGNHHGAQIAFERAADSGHPQAASVAAISLGALLKEAGDIEGARRMYQRAATCPISQVAEAARRRLADLPQSRNQ